MKFFNNGKRVHQFTPSIAPGDAISNSIMETQGFLQKHGYESQVFVENSHTAFKSRVKNISSYLGKAGDILIIHHGIGINCFNVIKKLPCRKILVYHNITPIPFFEEYDFQAIPALAKGRSQLEEYKNIVEFAFGVSEYNRQELLSYGYEKTDVLPVFMDFTPYADVLNEKLLSQYRDTKNILFVGRCVPNKRHEDIIRSFYCYNRYENPDSRLFLVGSHGNIKSYISELNELIYKLGIVEYVHMPGKVSFEDLCTYYRLADLFLCMSEHEGFCVPLIESFFMEVPIIAYSSTAIPYTMGDAGILVREKNYRLISALMQEVIGNDDLKQKIISKQKERIQNFTMERIGEKLLQRIV